MAAGNVPTRGGDPKEINVGPSAEPGNAAYHGVLRAHRASVTPDPVDWDKCEQAIGRISDGCTESGDVVFLHPKYEVMAGEAKLAGDVSAALFLYQLEGFKGRLQATNMAPILPTPLIIR